MIRTLKTRGAIAPAFACCILTIAVLVITGSAAGAQTVVLPRESVWRFEDSGVALPATWVDTGFVDAAWDSGAAPLGYGESYIVTPTSYGPDPQNKYITTYFRSTFDLQDDPLDILSFTLRTNFDDGFVAYLNGQEILRRSMPAGPILYSTEASLHEGGGYELWDASAAIPALTATGNVIAVEVHQASPNSSDLVMDFEVATSLSATVVRGPFLQLPSESGVTLCWNTNAATDARVWYGATPTTLTQSVTDPTVGFEHSVALSGLQPGTTYYYSVGTSTEALVGADADHRFATSPTPGVPTPVRIWVIGDSGQSGTSQDAVRDAYLSRPDAADTDLWLLLGDNAYEIGDEVEYQAALFDEYSDLLRNVPVFPTRGNHDIVRAGDSNDYFEFFQLPTAGESGGVASGTEAYYSFEFANVHFVCLDSEGSDRSPTGPMATWLRQDLAANLKDWTIAFWHHPPYTRGSHDSDDPGDSGGRMTEMRENFLPITDSLGVDLVLSGHSHSHERTGLLDGHYDVSSTLLPSMVLDGGNGRVSGDGAYEKATLGSAPHEGCVYVVAGNGSKTSDGPLDHPAMYASQDRLGSVLLDVTGARLDVTFIDENGTQRDSFTMTKGLVTPVPVGLPSSRLSVRASPSPFGVSTSVEFTVPSADRVEVRVIDAAGRVVRSLAENARAAGSHRVVWDGRDDRGRAVASGVYFVSVVQGGNVRATKVVLSR